MTDGMERPTPHEAAAALDSITQMTQLALRRGIYSRWFAAAVSVWVGAVAAATAYDGPAATGSIAALVVGGTLGLALWRHRSVARVRDVHGAVGTVTAVAAIGALLAIGLLGARAFEVSELSWAPLASGGVVATVLFIALEIFRRTTQAKLTARLA